MNKPSTGSELLQQDQNPIQRLGSGITRAQEEATGASQAEKSTKSPLKLGRLGRFARALLLSIALAAAPVSQITCGGESDKDKTESPSGITKDDIDGDGVENKDDNCDGDPNPDQEDLDDDGDGDICDEDVDGDDVIDDDDNCDEEPNQTQEDVDGDGIGAACDEDDCDGTNGAGRSEEGTMVASGLLFADEQGALNVMETGLMQPGDRKRIEFDEPAGEDASISLQTNVYFEDKNCVGYYGVSFFSAYSQYGNKIAVSQTRPDAEGFVRVTIPIQEGTRYFDLGLDGGKCKNSFQECSE